MPDIAASGNIIGKLLIEHRQSTASTKAAQELSIQMGVSLRTANRHLSATAELAAKTQHHQLECLATYLWRMQQAKVLKPCAMIVRHAYDETPLKLKVSSSEDQDAIPQISKVFATQLGWNMILRDLSKEDASSQASYLVLQGQCSHQLRASDSTAAESVAGIVTSTMQIPQRLLDLFPEKHRVVETDAAPANSKGERFHKNIHPEWQPTLRWECMAHKGHAIAERTWDLHKNLLTGITHTLLTLQGGQQMSLLLHGWPALASPGCCQQILWVLREGVSLPLPQYQRYLAAIFLSQLQARQKTSSIGVTQNTSHALSELLGSQVQSIVKRVFSTLLCVL